MRLIHEECFLDFDGSINGVGNCPGGSDRQTGAGAAEDDHGHGTHVTGIVTANGVQTGVGVAPGAQIVSVKVLDSTNSFAFFSEIVAGLDFILNNPQFGVQIINMSLGTFALFEGNCDASFTTGAAAIDALRASGVTSFVSSGNSSSGTSMGAPACIANSIAVGATDDNDVVTSFTNSNETLDIMAPGQSIVSSGLNNGTATFSGTSMASPHAAGCAALLLQAGEVTTPDGIEARLESSSIMVTDVTNGLSFPRIDCSMDVMANEPPIAVFTPSCDNLSCDFADASTDADGSVVRWDWDFGDGNSSTLQNPSHTYTTGGTFTVILTVTDDDGATGSTSQSVTIDSDVSTMHVENISSATIVRGAGSGTAEVTVTIHDTDGNPVADATVSGEFSGDVSGTPSGVTDANGEVVLASDSFTARPNNVELCVSGVTNATLTYDPNDNSDPSYACEGGGNVNPVASFTVSTNLLTADFTDTSSDSDGTVVSWAWDFGDGNSSSAQNPSNTYAANGTYTVMLTVTDDMGATGSASQSVTVNDGTGGGTMHIEDITTTLNRGGGNGTVDATFLIVDDNGDPVDGATVSGTFSGDLSGTDSGVTNSSGEAVLTSDSFTARPFDLGICADTVTHPTLTYDPGQNSDPGFDCSTAAPAKAKSGSDFIADVPTEFAIGQNYPNPFNPTTIITYGLPEASQVTIKVYNMLGQVVATLVDGQQAAGRYDVAFNASNLSAGIYLYTIEAGEFHATKRMTLLK